MIDIGYIVITTYIVNFRCKRSRNRKVCFFGHRDTPWSVQPKLREVILDLIDNQGTDEFYVGTHGNFDRMALAVLSKLSETRAFRFYIVLAYPPAEKENPCAEHDILLDGIENIPPRFAINYRNKFMVEAADIVVTYVNHSWGGAAKFKLLAEKKNRESLNFPHENTTHTPVFQLCYPLFNVHNLLEIFKVPAHLSIFSTATLTQIFFLSDGNNYFR